jgi:hypothetical protein
MPEMRGVYCFFHPANQRLWHELERHLTVLRRIGIITIVCDESILAGQNQPLIKDEFVETADIILLLMSHHLVASEEHWQIVLRAVERHKAGEAVAIYVSLSPICDDENLPIEHLPRLPKGKPIICWRNRQEAFVDVVRGVRDIIIQEVNESW